MDLTVFLIFVVVALLFIKRSKKNKQGIKYPPGPLCLPVIGSAYAMGTNKHHLHVTLTDLAKKWGPVYRLKVGPTPIVVITDPEIIRQTFNSVNSPVLLRFITKTARQMDKGLSLFFAGTRHHWALTRKIYTPITRNMPDGTSIQQVITGELKKLISAIDKQVNKQVYLNPLFMFFARNVFLCLSLSKAWSFDTENEEEKGFSNATNVAIDNLQSIADFIPSLDFLAKKSRKITIDNCRAIEHLLKNELQKRKNDNCSEASARDLLDLLLLEQKRNPEFTEEVMAYTFRNLLFASTLTTADTLDWIVLFLCVHPDIQDKCYKEISDKLQGRDPTWDDQPDLPYLESVIKETFRMRPTAPLSLPHFADEDCLIGGYHVEKGSVIFSNLYGIGNLEKFFKHAEQFDPERWQREPELSHNLLTFGYGPTTCLGMPIAKQEIFLTTASILQRYKFRIGSSTPSPDLTGEFKVTFNPKQWQTLISLR